MNASQQLLLATRAVLLSRLCTQHDLASRALLLKASIESARGLVEASCGGVSTIAAAPP